MSANPRSPETGDDVATLIAELAFMRKTHVDWADHFEQHPEVEAQYVATGEWDDAKEHRRCVDVCDRAIAALESLSTARERADRAEQERDTARLDGAREAAEEPAVSRSVLPAHAPRVIEAMREAMRAGKTGAVILVSNIEDIAPREVRAAFEKLIDTAALAERDACADAVLALPNPTAAPESWADNCDGSRDHPDDLYTAAFNQGVAHAYAAIRARSNPATAAAPGAADDNQVHGDNA